MNKLKHLVFVFSILCSFQNLYAQKTKVYGHVTDQETGEGVPYVKVFFYNSKIGTMTDSLGNYLLDTYYGTDSLVFSFLGYEKQIKPVQLDVSQEINCTLFVEVFQNKEVVIKPPDEFPSTILHKKIIANKPVNNKEKLEAYEYELYNKIQFDINNLGDKFKDRGYVKKLDLILDYLDSTESGESYLPLLLSETISDFAFKNNPKKKKEVIRGKKLFLLLCLK